MKLNKSIVLAGTALASLFVTSHAMAQSTASQEVEVVIKGSKKVAGPINKETGVKTRSVIDQDFISTQSSGQTVAQSLNVVPGYNFTNNDPYGSSGGNLRLRGLDGSRISLTQDGVQLNDAGNYAIYTNQQLDPEIIASASVLTGGTDVDSMTASSTGGTVNLQTRKPSNTFGVQATASIGSFNYTREFAMIDTGKFGPFGTSAFFSVSNQNYDTFTTEYVTAGTFSNGAVLVQPVKLDNGKLKKQQYNFRVWQPVGDNGSFVSVSGNWNVNRNRFIFSQSKLAFATFGYDYNTANATNINPSNTGNIKAQSKWVINDHLFVTFDPAYQSVLANGGGSSTLNEVTGRIGSWTNSNFANWDANHDGTLSTALQIYNPNTTATNRVSLQTGAVYTFSRGDTLRVGASFDRGRTRQSGEGVFLTNALVSPTAANNPPLNVFGAKEDKSLAILGKDGSAYERRYRFSLANVDVFSIEYRGHFFDDNLFVSVGLKSQKMERDLNQYCYSAITGTGSTTPFCTTQNPSGTTSYGAVTFAGITGAYTDPVTNVVMPSTSLLPFFRPYHTTVSFKKSLPSLGVTYKVLTNGQVYFNYSEALSSPRTDNYYALTASSTGAPSPANPLPETAKTMELGYRWNTSKLSATADIWQSKYDNRIVSSYDATTDTFFDRNVGKVNFNGMEASVAYAPTATMQVYANASYTKTEVMNDVPNGKVKTALGTDVVGTTLYIPLKGKQLVEVPKVMFNIGSTWKPTPNFQASFNGKFVGDRYSTDMNDDIAKGYFTIDGSLRYSPPVFKAGTYLQLNVINLTNQTYFGSISSTTALNTVKTASGTTIVSGGNPLTNSSLPGFNVGAPRTVILSLHANF